MAAATDWSCGIPCELLQSIAMRLDFFPDLNAFSCTCTSWRSSAKMSIAVVEDDEEGTTTTTTSLYSLRSRRSPPLIHVPPVTAVVSSSGGAYRYIPPPPQLGSTARSMAEDSSCVDDDARRLRWIEKSATICPGWLMLLDRDVRNYDSEITLLYPFSRHSLRLLPIKNFFATHIESVYDDVFLGKNSINDCCPFSSVVVIPDPAAADSVIVLASVDMVGDVLALCRVGDTDWTAVLTTAIDFMGFQMIYFGGRLYVLESCDYSVTAYVGGGDMEAEPAAEPPVDLIIPYDGCWESILAEYMGELLMVVKRHVYDDTKTRFLAFRLDLAQNKWIQMSDLRGGALCGTPWMPNCIYFEHECCSVFPRRRLREKGGPHDMGCYDIADCSIHPHVQYSALL